METNSNTMTIIEAWQQNYADLLKAFGGNAAKLYQHLTPDNYKKVVGNFRPTKCYAAVFGKMWEELGTLSLKVQRCLKSAKNWIHKCLQCLRRGQPMICMDNLNRTLSHYIKNMKQVLTETKMGNMKTLLCKLRLMYGRKRKVFDYAKRNFEY